MTAANVLVACAARRPGWSDGPTIGRRRFPCALPAGHDGPHVNEFNDEWADTDVPNHRHAEAARDAGRYSLVQDAAAHALTAVLLTPGIDAVHVLHTADRLFDVVDRWAKAAAIPSRWRVVGGDFEEVTTPMAR